MSDFNQIDEKTSLINDELKTISISDHEPSTLENHINKTECELESNDENDSKYEDVEEEDEEVDAINEAHILNKHRLKTITDDDELHINVKPRRLSKKRQDDEHSEGYDDEDDNQNVPNTKPKTTQNTKQSDKNKKSLDDDNNTHSPAYIPRKGKFYEHDDRTLDENDPSKQEISRNDNRFYKDSDVKWQHDLYFPDEQRSKPRATVPRRDQLQFNDHTSRSQQGRDTKHYQQYSNDYRRGVSHDDYTKSRNDRINNFEFKDYERSFSHTHHGYFKDTNTYEKAQTTSRQQRRDYDPYQIDDRTFHRRRNFTNSLFQQQDNAPKFNKNPHRNNQRQLGEHKDTYYNHEGKHQQQNRTLRKYDLYENKNNLPPRLQMNNNNRNLIQKQNSSSNLATNVSNIERPKRYSNMRNAMTNSIQIKHYQDQRSNTVEQNDWPQAPPPPMSYLPQLMTPQMFYQQQTSRYVPISQQLQENK